MTLSSTQISQRTERRLVRQSLRQTFTPPRDPSATPSGDEYGYRDIISPPVKRSRLIRMSQSQPLAKKRRVSKARASTTDISLTTRAKYKYCGLRVDDPAYLPLEASELNSLFAYNPHPHLPCHPDLTPAYEELEKDWEESVEDQLRNEDSSVDDATVTAVLAKKRRAGDFNPTYDEFRLFCMDLNISLTLYMVPDSSGLTATCMDRLQTYVKNRMFLMLYFTKAQKEAIVRDVLGIHMQHDAWTYAINVVTNTSRKNNLSQG
ncbi:hypothetical protein BJ508DRAFT_323916 [Ascobolus immersus RN42]|uniref:Uncharacterized protein n=1 Tax=Ascobolus immersus RN42 TaxID=1160509 RepID=A0A3N4ICR9_ASCIM|nr:hypothetical protein BJ508DRAFT_323916 [Ascobolus immersus RN42]